MSSSDEDLPKFECLQKPVEKNLLFNKRGNMASSGTSKGRDPVRAYNLDRLPRVDEKAPASKASSSNSGLYLHGW